MTIYFTPPVRALVPTTVPRPHPGNGLFRHYGPRRRGVNVFVYGGVVTELERDGVVPDRLYHGGHVCEISAAEAEVLADAGYIDFITGYHLAYGDGRYGDGLYGAMAV